MVKFIFFRFIFCILPVVSFSQIVQPAGNETNKIYYQTPGSIILQGGNTMFAKRKMGMPPVSLMAQVTVAKNFSVGPLFTYFNFKRSEFEAVNATRWVNPDIRYHEMMAGLRGEYHLNSVIQKIINRTLPENYLDVYVVGWSGYSFVKSGSASAEQKLINDNQKIRGGVMIGARSLVVKWFGFSLEAGYSSYGYCSFGLFFMVR